MQELEAASYIHSKEQRKDENMHACYYTLFLYSYTVQDPYPKMIESTMCWAFSHQLTKDTFPLPDTPTSQPDPDSLTETFFPGDPRLCWVDN